MNKTLIFSISAAFLTLVCGGCTETNQFFDSPVKPGTSVEEPEPEPEPSGELCAFPVPKVSEGIPLVAVVEKYIM